jgi:hypothetical protein
MDQAGLETGGPEAEAPAFSEDGVDLTLIRWTLSLSPQERLDVLQGFLDSVAEIRERDGSA